MARAGDTYDVFEDESGISVRIFDTDLCPGCPLRGSAMGRVRLAISLMRRSWAGGYELPSRYQCRARDEVGGRTTATTLRSSWTYPRPNASIEDLIRRMHDRSHEIVSTFSARINQCAGANSGICPSASPTVTKHLIEQ